MKQDKEIIRSGKQLAKKECANWYDDICLMTDRPCRVINPAYSSVHDGCIPDNAGNKPCHELIIKEGREAYFSSLPVKDIEKNLNDNGIPSSVSYGADNE